MSTPARFYHDPECRVCRDAAALLAARRVDVEMIDVAADPRRRPEGVACLPALAVGGRIYARGRFNPVLLDRLIRAGALSVLAPSEAPP